MPLDPAEDLERGNVLLDHRGVAFAFKDRAAAIAAADEDELLYDTTYISHHVTCPHRAAPPGARTRPKTPAPESAQAVLF